MARVDTAGSPRLFSSFKRDSEGDHGHLDLADRIPSGHCHKELHEWLCIHLTGIMWRWLSEQVNGGQVASGKWVIDRVNG